MPTAPKHAELTHLREALEQIASALTNARLDDLVAAETSLATAVAALPARYHLEATDHEGVRAEIERSQAALLRCRRLGASLSEFARLSLRLHEGSSGYDKTGQSVGAVPAHTLDARV